MIVVLVLVAVCDVIVLDSLVVELDPIAVEDSAVVSVVESVGNTCATL